MMKVNSSMHRSKNILAVFLILLSYVSQAQGTGDFKIFFEKVYLHTDRSHYGAGEDVWFKAYLINAQTGIRINTSSNLYVELISPKEDIIKREIIYLQNGLGTGDFILPANAASGNYRIRAYTSWMQNFGDLFIFEKNIMVAADPAEKNTIPARYSPEFINGADAATAGSNSLLQFYPEGGTLLAGVKNQLAFNAVNQYGKGIALNGKIINAAGDSIAALQTTHQGMGFAVYTPQPGITYKAVGTYAGGEKFAVELPAAAGDGYAMHLGHAGENISIEISTTDVSSAPLLLINRHAGRKNYTDSSVVIKGGKVTVIIPQQELPAGINIITLYDAQRRPQCERLFFVDHGSEAFIKLQPNTTAAHAGEKIDIGISVTDAQNNPLQARLSFSATDATLIPAQQTSIASYFMLESELKGDVENPVQYFDVANTKRSEQLDLLLQVQGWRQFVWRRLADTSVVIKYLPEPGITLSGKVQKLVGKKGLPDMNVTLYAQKSKGDKLYITKTNADGRYFFDGLPLYGIQDVRVSARNSSTLKREGEIFLDSVLTKAPKIGKIPDFILDTSALTANFWRNAGSRNKIMQAQDKMDKGELENVTVTALQRPDIRLVEDAVMRFGPDSLFIINAGDGRYKTIENFVLQRYPFARFNAAQDGFFFLGDAGAIIRPRWVVDGQEERFSTGNSMNVDEETGRNDGAYDRVDYFNIPITKVKSIRITPVVNQANKQIYVVHLSLLPGAMDSPDYAILNATINGYYESRTYFEPVFKNTTGNVTKSDLRSTIFWAPLLQTGDDGKTAVQFTNSPAKAVQVCVEGITDKGVPVAAMLRYELR